MTPTSPSAKRPGTVEVTDAKAVPPPLPAGERTRPNAPMPQELLEDAKPPKPQRDETVIVAERKPADGSTTFAPKEATKTSPAAVVPQEEPLQEERTGTAPGELMRNMGNRLAGRYELASIIGEGGMGMVYQARDLELGEDIAIKLLLPHFTKNKNDVARFKREIVTARKITHPNVIRIHDFGITKREAFISMELLTGGTLADRMEDALSFDDQIEIAIGIADGLGEAHRKGVIHRDIKPQNVMFDAEGTVKLLDFGIARLATAKSTTVGFTGTPFYMAPEQADAKAVTSRSDVYSLGVLMFELFTGRLPFESESIIKLAIMHAGDAPPLPRSINPNVPPGLENVILRCLEKVPEKRYANAAEVGYALRQFSSEHSAASMEMPIPNETVWEEPSGQIQVPPRAEPPVRPVRPTPWTAEQRVAPPERGSRKLVAAIGAVAVLMVLAGVVYGVQQWVTGATPTPTSVAVATTAPPTPTPAQTKTAKKTPTPRKATPRATRRRTPIRTPAPTPVRATPRPTPTPNPTAASWVMSQFTLRIKPWGEYRIDHDAKRAEGWHPIRNDRDTVIENAPVGRYWVEGRNSVTGEKDRVYVTVRKSGRGKVYTLDLRKKPKK